MRRIKELLLLLLALATRPAMADSKVFDRFDMLKVANPKQFEEVAVKIKVCRFAKGEATGDPEAYSFVCELQSNGQVQFTTMDYKIAESLIGTGPHTLQGMVLSNQSNGIMLLRTGEFENYVNFVASTKCREIEKREGWSRRNITCDRSPMKNCQQIVDSERRKVEAKVKEQCSLVTGKIRDALVAERNKGQANAAH